MAAVLLVYASKQGHTAKIAECIAEGLRVRESRRSSCGTPWTTKGRPRPEFAHSHGGLGPRRLPYEWTTIPPRAAPVSHVTVSNALEKQRWHIEVSKAIRIEGRIPCSHARPAESVRRIEARLLRRQ